MEASATTAGGDRSVLERSPFASVPDQLLRWGLTALAGGVLVLIAYFFIRLIGQSGDAFSNILAQLWNNTDHAFGRWPSKGKAIHDGYPGLDVLNRSRHQGVDKL